MENDEIIEVPFALIEAVAHIGEDFGFGPYTLNQEWIKKAREIIEVSKTEKSAKIEI